MRVFVATPAHGPLEPEVAHAYARLLSWLDRHVAAATWRIEARNPNQALARNCLAHLFLESGYDVMICGDRDSVFEPEDVANLFRAGRDVVGACCKMRTLDSNWVGSEMLPRVQDGALIEMARIGFGLVALTRHAVSTMAANAPSIVPQTGACAGKFIAEVFRPEVDPETRNPIGVDYAFSDRWRALGGHLWLHTGVQIGHVGPHVFR